MMTKPTPDRKERALMFLRGWFGEPMDEETREELIRLLCAFAIAEMQTRARGDTRQGE